MKVMDGKSKILSMERNSAMWIASYVNEIYSVI